MFQTIFVHPIYNAFIFLVGHVPYGDVGLAIIALTLIMRAVLYPIFTASIRTQMGMQAMQPELDVVSEKYKNDKDKLAQERMELLKKYKVNPFAGIAALVVQLVLIIALYYALFREGFPHIDTSVLYSFVHAPTTISTSFFGLIDLLTPHHIVLAALVALTQFFAIRLTLRRTPVKGGDADKVAMQKMQQNLMLYFMPALMAVFGYFFAGAVGLYFLVSNVVSIGQEWLIRRHLPTQN
jgi:YidC/Oxa1 family membrane protein insertase